MVKTTELPPEVLEAMRMAFWNRGGYDGVGGLKDALAALREHGYTVEPDWRPIEDAPRDGTPVLLYGNPLDDSTHHWWADHWVTEWTEMWEPVDEDTRKRVKHDNSHWVEYGFPTHFRPIPAPPEDEA